MLDGHFRTPIERWMRPVGVSVKRAGISADAVTVAGLVIHEAQAIPDPGQRFAFHGYRFQVLRKQRNQLTALRVEREMEELGEFLRLEFGDGALARQ